MHLRARSADGLDVVDVSGASLPAHPGEERATAAEFSRLYERLFPAVYPFMRSQVSSVETAQELVGRVFLKACRHWHTAPRGEAATYWVFRIARTTLIDYWRVEGRRESVSVSLEELGETRDAGADPESIYSAKERSRLLLRAAATLSQQDRILLALRFAGHRTNQEIAAILGINEAAVSMRLLRTLRRLRQQLRQAGL